MPKDVCTKWWLINDLQKTYCTKLTPCKMKTVRNNYCTKCTNWLLYESITRQHYGSVSVLSWTGLCRLHVVSSIVSYVYIKRRMCYILHIKHRLLRVTSSYSFPSSDNIINFSRTEDTFNSSRLISFIQRDISSFVVGRHRLSSPRHFFLCCR